jgi:hypothetical protein
MVRACCIRPFGVRQTQEHGQDALILDELDFFSPVIYAHLRFSMERFVHW